MSADDSGGAMVVSTGGQCVAGDNGDTGEAGGREEGDMGSSMVALARPSFCLYSQFSSDKLAFSIWSCVLAACSLAFSAINCCFSNFICSIIFSISSH